MATPNESWSTFLSFTLLGFGSGWSLADALYGNMAAFMAALPERLFLPALVEISGKATIGIALVACWVLTAAFGTPTLPQLQAVLWSCYAMGISGCLVAALAWRTVINGVSVVVVGMFVVSYLVGSLTMLVVFPLLPVFYVEETLAAVFTGNGLGTLLAGMLGLLQAAWPAFNPTAYLLCVGGLICLAVFAYAYILRERIGLRPEYGGAPAPAATAAPAAVTPAKTRAAASKGEEPTEQSALLVEGSEDEPSRAGWTFILRRVAPLCLIFWPVTGATWGSGPVVIQFATAHAGCSCDTTAPEPQHTYYYAMSISFILLPVAGLLSYVRPVFQLRTLAVFAALHLSLACIVLAAARGAPRLTCSLGARILVVTCVALTRALETYLGSCAFRIVVRRLEGTPALQKRASLAFGHGLMIVQLVFGCAAFVLVHTGAIRCTLPDADAAQPLQVPVGEQAKAQPLTFGDMHPLTDATMHIGIRTDTARPLDSGTRFTRVG